MKKIKEYFARKQQEWEEAEAYFENMREKTRKSFEAVFQERKEKKEEQKRKLEAIFYEKKEEFIQICKQFLRTDEKHAGDVLIFYNFLHESGKEHFLSLFDEEERTFLVEQSVFVPDYSERVIKEAIYYLHENTGYTYKPNWDDIFKYC